MERRRLCVCERVREDSLGRRRVTNDNGGGSFHDSTISVKGERERENALPTFPFSAPTSLFHWEGKKFFCLPPPFSGKFFNFLLLFRSWDSCLRDPRSASLRNPYPTTPPSAKEPPPLPFCRFLVPRCQITGGGSFAEGGVVG